MHSPLPSTRRDHKPWLNQWIKRSKQWIEQAWDCTSLLTQMKWNAKARQFLFVNTLQGALTTQVKSQRQDSPTPWKDLNWATASQNSLSTLWWLPFCAIRKNNIWLPHSYSECFNQSNRSVKTLTLTKVWQLRRYENRPFLKTLQVIARFETTQPIRRQLFQGRPKHAIQEAYPFTRIVTLRLTNKVVNLAAREKYLKRPQLGLSTWKVQTTPASRRLRKEFWNKLQSVHSLEDLRTSASITFKLCSQKN